MKEDSLFFIIIFSAIAIIFIPVVPHVFRYFKLKASVNGRDSEAFRREEVYLKKLLVRSIAIILWFAFPVILFLLKIPIYVLIPLCFLSFGMLPLVSKYIEANVGFFGLKKYKTEAKKRANKIKYENPVIVCDACNSEIDTSLYKVCPRCGAPYADDLQWQKRHMIDTDSEELNADEFVEKQFEQAKSASEGASKEIKDTVKAYVLLFVLALLALGFIFFPVLIESIKQNRYNSSNDAASQAQTEYKYSVKGDGVLLDCDAAKIYVKGFRKSESNPRNVKMDFIVKNRTGKNISVYLNCIGMNGSYFSSPDSFVLEADASDEISVDSFEIEDTKIRTIFDISFSVERIEDREKSETVYEPEKNNQIIFATKNKAAFADADVFYGKEIYDENGLSVVIVKSTFFKKYSIHIKNESDDNYIVNPSAFIINGSESDELPFGLAYITPDNWYVYDDIKLKWKEEAEFAFDYADLDAYISEDTENFYNTDLLKLD